MKIRSPERSMGCLIVLLVLLALSDLSHAADRIIIGNVSRTVEQLPNYAATDKGFFAQEGIQGDVVLIGSTDTLAVDTEGADTGTCAVAGTASVMLSSTTSCMAPVTGLMASLRFSAQR